MYATSATADLCGAMLRDSAYIQQKDADFLNKRHRRRKKLDRKAKEGPPKAGPIEPLYTIEDAEKLLPLFRTYAYREAVSRPSTPSGEKSSRSSSKFRSSANRHVCAPKSPR